MLVAVPCSGDDCVLLLDAAEGTEHGRIGVGPHPVHLETVGDRVFVATMGDRAITVIVDGEPRRVETGVLGPSHFAATADGRVLVPCTGGDSLAIIDGERLELEARVAVGAEPHDVALFEGHAFVGSRADGTVSVVDPDAARVRGEFDLGPDARIQGLAAGPEGVYAVDQRQGQLSWLTADGVIDDVAVGENPYDVTVAGAHALVPGRSDGTVTEVSLDLRDREVHAVGGKPTALAEAGGTWWVTDRDSPSLRSVDGRTIDLPFPAFAVADLPGRDSQLVAVHYDDDAVSLVSVEDGGTRWTTRTPARPLDTLVV